MAFGRLERRATPQPMSEINMTPLIDVMLVLLVIFMVTAPLIASSLKLNLPRAEAATPANAPQAVNVSIAPDGQFYWEGAAVSAQQLSLQARRSAQARPDTEVQLRADRAVPYGRVAELIGLVQGAGLTRIGFVTEAATAAAAASASGTR
jgi:biopolymer transport protein ExbD/biopolymer transport protein TolR